MEEEKQKILNEKGSLWAAFKILLSLSYGEKINAEKFFEIYFDIFGSVYD